MTENQFTPEDADRALQILNAGADDMIVRGIQVVADDLVWNLLSEAVRTIEGLPDQDRKWLSSGSRSGGWSMISMTGAEARTVERQRLMSGITPGDGLKFSPQEFDIDRALTIIDWLRFCRSERRGLTLQRGAYWCAAGDEFRARSFFRPEAGGDRKTLGRLMVEIRKQACMLIVLGLRTSFGITLGQDQLFERNSDHVPV